LLCQVPFRRPTRRRRPWRLLREKVVEHVHIEEAVPKGSELSTIIECRYDSRVDFETPPVREEQELPRDFMSSLLLGAGQYFDDGHHEDVEREGALLPIHYRQRPKSPYNLMLPGSLISHHSTEELRVFNTFTDQSDVLDKLLELLALPDI